jgi:hypothetical protein
MFTDRRTCAYRARETGPGRRVMELIGRALVGLAVAAVGLGGAGALPLAGSRAWAAPPTVGAQITDVNHNPLNSGGSQTIFSVSLPTGAACSKDSANGRYYVYGYIVPSATYPGALTWDSNGPVLPLNPPDNDTHTLYDTTGSPWVGQNTAINTGQVPQPPNFNWANYTPTGNSGATLALPASTTGTTYNVGIACVTPSIPGQVDSSKTDKFWNVQLTFSTSPSDPNGETWAVVTGTGSQGVGTTGTSTILGTSPTSEAAPGAAVTLTATVTCTSPGGVAGCPSSGMGSVEFSDVTNSTNPISLGTATVSAASGASAPVPDTGSITTTTLASGTRSLTAKFIPTDLTQFDASASPPVQFTISASATTTTTTAPTTATTAPGGTPPGGTGTTTTTTPGGATPLADQSASGQSADTPSGAGTTSSSSPDAPASSGLPVTGAAPLTLVNIGAFLVAAGLAVVMLTRRRRSRGRRSRLA